MVKVFSKYVDIKIHVCIEDPNALPADFERIRRRVGVNLDYFRQSSTYKILAELEEKQEIKPGDKPWFVFERACICDI
jgi:hypothetical protein